ncbi:MAG: 1-phosphofructokinase [Armatimonadetes bacterium]|nr:1-phosphofructokinase [Armatimonadota bacterium]
MILTVTLNPSVDETLFVGSLQIGDTNRVTRVELDAGGKGVNVARVFVALGGQAVATGFLGGRHGRFVQMALNEEGVETDFEIIAGRTRRNICIEEAEDRPPTTLNEAGPTITEENWNALLERVKKHLPRVKWMATGGSLPPGAPRDAYKTLLELAREHGVSTVLDAEGPAMMQGLHGKPTMIKPNELEAERLVGMNLHSDNDFLGAASALSKKHGIPFVIISRGARGAVAITQHGAFKARPPLIQARSTVGSGDSLVGGALFIAAEGGTFEEALKWGVAAGTATAMTSGSEICTRQDTEKMLPEIVVQKIA